MVVAETKRCVLTSTLILTLIYFKFVNIMIVSMSVNGNVNLVSLKQVTCRPSKERYKFNVR